VTAFYGKYTFEDIMNGTVVYEQNTSFRSYFILKYALLYNFNDYLKTLSNEPVIHGERLLVFGELINRSIQKIRNDKTIIDLFNVSTAEFFQSIEEKSNQWINRTGRMSVNDMLMIN
jgi:hypothetical protein